MHGCPTGCTIEQPVVKGFDNRLYRINGVLVSSGQHWNKTFSRLDHFLTPNQNGQTAGVERTTLLRQKKLPHSCSWFTVIQETISAAHSTTIFEHFFTRSNERLGI